MAFYACIVKPGKPTPQVPHAQDGIVLHLSQASLSAAVPKGKRVSVLVHHKDDDPVVIATLCSGTLDSVSLDLFLQEYTEYTLEGDAVDVHLSGYYTPSLFDQHPDDDDDDEGEDDEDEEADPVLLAANRQLAAMRANGMIGNDDGDDEDDEDEDEDEEGDEDEDEEDDVLGLGGGRNKPHVVIEELDQNGLPKKKKNGKDMAGEAKRLAHILGGDDDDVDDEEDEDEDEEGGEGGEDEEEGEGMEGEEGEEGEDEDEDEDEDEEEEEEKVKASGKKQQQPADKVGAKRGAEQPQQQPPAKQPKTPQPVKQQQQQQTPKSAPQLDGTKAGEIKSNKKNVRRWENGFEIAEVQLGPANGKLAKGGKTVLVHYTGRLKSNGKVFDKSAGKPFKFRLGVGEVIKGWDLGVEGMRVGDKRKLVIPAQLAYGSSGVKGTIPPNATLEFDVELVDVK